MKPRKAIWFAAAVALSASFIEAASAHCDSLDGPVVRDARSALDGGDPTQVLKWVRQEHEAEIRASFDRALAVRALGADAKALADTYFFETLVRLHRAGEGEAFTGLKPAGQIEPGIVAADQALENGSGDALAKRMSSAAAAALESLFRAAAEAKRHAADSVEEGRRYVEAYVEYVHFVENLDRLIELGAPRVHHEPGVP
jgi:uncharacterized protein DUF6448